MYLNYNFYSSKKSTCIIYDASRLWPHTTIGVKISMSNALFEANISTRCMDYFD